MRRLLQGGAAKPAATSAAALAAAAPPITASLPLARSQPPCSRYVKINLLVGGPLYFLVEAKWKTKEVQALVSSYMKSNGMMDAHLFGLAIVLEGEYVFIEPRYKLSKYAPKSWRSSSTNGLDGSGKPLLEFFYRVQFYIDSPLLLRDEICLEHYFTQVQSNFVERGMVGGGGPSLQAAYTLAGLALQATYGDDSSQPQYYSNPSNYLPHQWIGSCLEERGSILLTTLHRANHGMSQSQARLQYIKEASLSDIAPIPYNTHLFRLRESKTEPLPGNVLLAISTKGIHLFQENSSKALSGTFFWNDIGKLCFERKKFEIRGVNWPSGDKYSYYTSSDDKSKHLLSLCKETHQQSMSQPRLSQVTTNPNSQTGISEKKQRRNWSVEVNKYQTRYSGSGEQRISVISSTSSTTTSGIVSDRVHSLDESEDDLELEIMINCPPAASVESLALAHLKDNSDSSPSLRPPSQSRQDGVSIGGMVSATGTTEGSQCSSSASTVVGGTLQPLTQAQLGRCESVTSSLELGYSHTAEHSVAGSCAEEVDCSVRSQPTSGVYTLDTVTHGTHTPLTASHSSGIGHSQVGLRSRSGSLVSQSGSFHGDGSDPSEAGQGNPLSAEELSNLIVNPGSPQPRRGVYPSRATVSSTLDSCSDYVTLPPPPPPPPPPHPLVLPLPLYPLLSSDRFVGKQHMLSGHLPSVPRIIPLVAPNNYLDFRSSYLRQPPPPPPPRPNVATVYTSQVTRSQIEQFKQQLYSDVDYVIYPMKDPSLSKQEYLDSKLLSCRYTPPPPYPSKSFMYRSTPNVTALSSSYLPYNKFASNQNLSDYYLSGSPLYSGGASYSSSSHSLHYDWLPTTPAFHRTLSHDDILHVDTQRPPPPAPPITLSNQMDLMLGSVGSGVCGSSLKGSLGSGSFGLEQKMATGSSPPSGSSELATSDSQIGFDISSLREKSRNLDLPLISALCNDNSLLKQTKAFVVPHHANLDRKSLLSTLLKSSPSSASSKFKYPVSGLSTNQIVKACRKPSSRHKHPDPNGLTKISRSQSANISYKHSKS